MFLGEMLKVGEDEDYYDVAIAVETGYNTDIYSIRFPSRMLTVKPSPGNKVLFTGYHAMGDGMSKFILKTIKYQEFTSCIRCGLALTYYCCLTKHDNKAQKFEGEWQIVQKMEREGNIKMYFLRGRESFAAVAQPKNYVCLRWLFARFSKLQEGDRVRLQAWRYKQRTTISFIEKL